MPARKEAPPGLDTQHNQTHSRGRGEEEAEERQSQTRDRIRPGQGSTERERETTSGSPSIACSGLRSCQASTLPASWRGGSSGTATSPGIRTTDKREDQCGETDRVPLSEQQVEEALESGDLRGRYSETWHWQQPRRRLLQNKSESTSNPTVLCGLLVEALEQRP